MAVLGLLLVAAFRLIVTEARVRRHEVPVEQAPSETAATPAAGADTPKLDRAPFSSLFTNPAVLCAYLGSGMQMFMAAVMLTWLPTFFKETYGLPVGKAGGMAALFVMLVGSGMVVCGFVADRISLVDPTRKWTAGVVFCVIAFASLMIAFRMPTGTTQLVLLGIGAFFSAGCSGTSAAMVASLTHRSIQASAMGTLTLANNLLGLAAAPILIGILADSMGLMGALKIAPLVYIPAAVAMIVGRRLHPAGLARLRAISEGVAR